MSQILSDHPTTLGSRQVRTLSEKVYQGLRQDILCLRLPPGYTFFEGDVARQYDVSKSPVREALKRLMQEGLVQSIPGVGSTVAPVTLKDVSDLFGYRRLLETAAVQSAAKVATNEQLSELEMLAGECFDLDSMESRIRWHLSNVEFHVRIAAIAGNRRIEQALRGILEEMQRIERIGLDKRRHTAEMVQEHLGIVAALRQHDCELATVRAMAAVDQAIRLIQEYLGGN